jgi:hypothetical protein
MNKDHSLRVKLGVTGDSVPHLVFFGNDQEGRPDLLVTRDNVSGLCFLDKDGKVICWPHNSRAASSLSDPHNHSEPACVR